MHAASGTGPPPFKAPPTGAAQGLGAKGAWNLSAGSPAGGKGGSKSSWGSAEVIGPPAKKLRIDMSSNESSGYSSSSAAKGKAAGKGAPSPAGMAKGGWASPSVVVPPHFGAKGCGKGGAAGNMMWSKGGPGPVMPKAASQAPGLVGGACSGASLAQKQDAQAELKRQQDELKRQQEEEKKAEKDLKAEQLELAALELQRQLMELFDAAEPLVAEAKAKAEAVQAFVKEAPDDDEIIRCVDEFDLTKSAAKASLKPCFEFMVGKHLQLQGRKPQTKADGLKLITNLQQASRQVDGLSDKVAALGRQARLRREREKQKLAAIEENKRRREVFNSFDLDADGFLSATELEAYVQAEHEFTLPPGRAAAMLNTLTFKGLAGAPYEKYPQLKVLIDIAKEEQLAKVRRKAAEERKGRVAIQLEEVKKVLAGVTGAVDGIDTEVLKAEELVRPLLAMRGRLVGQLPVIEERTEKAEAAIDAARDFIGAARDQAPCLGKEKESLEPEVRASPEVRRVDAKLNWFTQRLFKASQAVKAIRQKLELQKRKDALLQDAEAAPQAAPQNPT